ncbi:uncharacterized protein LOC119079030 [Bradysia coprophila]|uniref:uncharacterized protein LOC119079030 n=1 Tax=Bradysia coprophila TaxID=38358 RepID=UPI00187D7702|nr:uncharacterized protein LOC119079030 [Bradysia coprophila]
MLRNKINFVSLVWCIVLYGPLQRVITAEPLSNDDVMVIEGRTIHSSHIKLLLADRNITKIYVYLTDTFHVDANLELNGIEEIQIFANLWNITMPVTFDLSGTDGASQQESAVNGSAGYAGNDGTAGGNFFGLTGEIINGDYLTVRSNGGNGAAGQNGSGSDDVYVLLNVDDGSGESGWFSSGDILSYYKKYFSDRGYDAEISDVDDHTSLYAVFVHNRNINFTVELHPKKCCGSTGIGGVGGLGGRRGELRFYHIGNNKSQSTPRLVAYDGNIGKQGKDGRTCESLALNIRIDAKLQKAIFIFVPLHHSFSSQVTILNHTSSSRCEPLYLTTFSSDPSEPNEIDFSSAILRFKRFLLKNMKNDDASQAAIVQETYKAMDIDNRINYENSLNGLLMEAVELEKIYFELESSIDVTSLYERLLHRVERVMLKHANKDDERSLTHLRFILYLKLDDMRALSDTTLFVNLEQFTKTVASRIELAYRLVSPIKDVNDAESQTNLNQLLYNVHQNSFLDQYHQAIEWFRFIYFPFAASYLENYRLPASPSAYADLNAIVSMTTSHLNTLSQDIKNIDWNNSGIMLNLNHTYLTDPQNALYIWRNADVRNEIRQLFTGRKVTLLADVRTSRFNAFKFNTIDVVFRSSEQTVNDRLKKVLSSFQLNLNHTGRSSFRCNTNFYQIDSKPTFLISRFAEDRTQESRNDVTDKLRNNYPILSPFTLWELQLVENDKSVPLLDAIAQFRELDIDIELHVTGTYIEEQVPICDNENLAKLYTPI